MADGEHFSGENGLSGSEPQTKGDARGWQPLTFRGVAALARDTYGRLMIVAAAVGIMTAAGACRWAQVAVFPSLREAVAGLPETGGVTNQVLGLPGLEQAILVEDRVVGVLMDLNNSGYSSLASDFQVVFRRERVEVCSLFGCASFAYPQGYIVELNRKVLEPGFQAWKGMVYALIFLGAFFVMAAGWHVLATLYCLAPWAASFYIDRRLTLSEAWRLSMASLLAPAMLMTLGLLAYAYGYIDLVRTTILFAVHVLAGWIYVAGSLRHLSPLRTSSPGAVTGDNPFKPPPPPEAEASEPPAVRSKNPFVASPASTKRKLGGGSPARELDPIDPDPQRTPQ